MQTTFTFSTVPHLVSEPGGSKRTGALVAQHFPVARRALIVTDAGFLGTELVDPAVASLRTAGLGVTI